MNILAADFETTLTDDGNIVYLGGLQECMNEKSDPLIFRGLMEWLNYIQFNLNDNSEIYFHNLHYDGNFILYRLKVMDYYDATYQYFSNTVRRYKLKKHEYCYLIDEHNKYFMIKVNFGRYTVLFKDSAKIFPMSLEKLGESLKMPFKKGVIKYNDSMDNIEKNLDVHMEYLKKDLGILAYGIRMARKADITDLTIGAAAMRQYKNMINQLYRDDTGLDELDAFKQFFVDLGRYPLRNEIYNATNCDEYIRRAYRGAWCYLNPMYRNKVINKPGKIYDVNASYSYNMHSISSNLYPHGFPRAWVGNYIPTDALSNYYFVTIKFTRCVLKKGYFPFISFKGNLMYNQHEYITDSNINHNGMTYAKVLSISGKISHITHVLTLTCTDFDMFREFYDIENLEILHGIWFRAIMGLFDIFIDDKFKVKSQRTGPLDFCNKMLLNHLSGKFAVNPVSFLKILNPELNDKKILQFHLQRMPNKFNGNVAIAAAITSYGRKYIWNKAMLNCDKFIYCDTDSLALLDEGPELQLNISEGLGDFKIESPWTKALFLKQKAYILEYNNDYNIKMAGATERTKATLTYALKYNSAADAPEEYRINMDEDEEHFINAKWNLQSLTRPFTLPNQLRLRLAEGGAELVKTEFKIK